MKPRTIQSLLDVHEYCLELTAMIGSATVAEYLADRGLRLKTERLLEIIYDAISDETVWKAATVGVPELQQKVDELLDREGELPPA